MIDNPYNEEDKRERILNQIIIIKFERNIYTTPTIIDFWQKKRSQLHNPIQTPSRYLR